MMFLYLISQDESNAYTGDRAALIAARTPEEARNIAFIANYSKEEFSWQNLPIVLNRVTYLGAAHEEMEAGIILTSNDSLENFKKFLSIY